MKLEDQITTCDFSQLHILLPVVLLSVIIYNTNKVNNDLAPLLLLNLALHRAQSYSPNDFLYSLMTN